MLAQDEEDSVRQNLAILRQQLRVSLRHAWDGEHHGRVHPVSWEHSGTNGGRRRAVIDEKWLRWAYQTRTTSAIAQYLHVSRPVVRRSLLEYGIAEQGERPRFIPLERRRRRRAPQEPQELGTEDDDIPALEPIPISVQRPNEAEVLAPSNDAGHPAPPDTAPIQINRTSRGPVSSLTDEDLEGLIRQIRVHMPTAGLSILSGSLRSMGHIVPQQRIRHALLQIDPVRRIFGRQPIQRRTYNVAGPNSLWHHDGQHGKFYYCSSY